MKLVHALNGLLTFVLVSAIYNVYRISPPYLLTDAARIVGERKHQLQQDPFIPDGAVIFLGDSITAGLAVSAIAPHAVNFGIGGQTAVDLLDAMPDYHVLDRASLVVLTIGTNDINALDSSTAEIAPRLERIAEHIHVPMLWSAIPPSTHFNAVALNAEIRKQCAAKPGCRFVQADIRVADLQPDGIHLNPSGYVKWIGAITAAVRAVPTVPGGALPCAACLNPAARAAP